MENELDLHVWVKPETERMLALCTLSINRGPLCVDMPLDAAAKCFRELLDDMA